MPINASAVMWIYSGTRVRGRRGYTDENNEGGKRLGMGGARERRAYASVNYSTATASSGSWTSVSDAQLGSRRMIGVEMTTRQKRDVADVGWTWLRGLTMSWQLSRVSMWIHIFAQIRPYLSVNLFLGVANELTAVPTRSPDSSSSLFMIF